jgi:hypothetical protein
VAFSSADGDASALMSSQHAGEHMTKKHFEVIAKAIREQADIKRESKIILANLLADEFEALNPRFNRQTFIDAVVRIDRGTNNQR